MRNYIICRLTVHSFLSLNMDGGEERKGIKEIIKYQLPIVSA